MKLQSTFPFDGTPGGTGNIQIHIIGLGMAFISACSLFKEKYSYQTDSLQHREIKRELIDESSVKSEVISFLSSTDSSDKQAFAEIFPKGTFQYSPAEGFRGEANRVVINERIKHAREEREFTTLALSGKSRTALKESEEQGTEMRLKERKLKTGNRTLFYVAGFALGLMFLHLWCRLRKQSQEPGTKCGLAHFLSGFKMTDSKRLTIKQQDDLP